MRSMKMENTFMQLKRLTPYFIILLLSFAFTFPIFKSLNNTGINDWDLFCYFEEAPRKTILEYHQFPLWNPYAWGGHSSIGNLQAGFLRPSYLLTLLFGCVVGLKIEIFFMIVLAMIGMFLLAKYYKMCTTAGLLAASIFGLSSYFSLHMTEGHVWVFAFALLPLIFLFFLRSLQQKWCVVPTAIFFVLVVFAGGNVHVAPLASFFLTTYAVILSIKDRDIKPLLNLFFIFLLVFGFGAIKILPALEGAIKNPRLTDLNNELTNLSGLYHVFLGHEQLLGVIAFEGQKYGWHEYGAYTGLIPLILFLLALFYFWRKEMPLILTGLLAFLVSLGNFAKWAPWNLLHELPFFESTRVPSRFIILFIFSTSILVGLVFDFFYKKSRHSTLVRCLFFIIVLLTIFDLLIVNGKTFDQAFPNVPAEVHPNEFFHQIIDHNQGRSGAKTSQYPNLLSNVGTLNGYGWFPPADYPVKALGDVNYKGEVYLEGDGMASYVYWSPNKLSVNVGVLNVTRLVINQNYDAGWHVKRKIAENFESLLATTVSPSDETVEFYYLPTSFLVGLTVTLVSVIITIFLLMRKTF